MDKGSDVYINDSTLREPQLLSKYDVIQIDGKKYYWADYLYEGRKQTLYLKDIFSIRGRISRGNFRALTVLLLGLSACVYYLPGFAGSFIMHQINKLNRDSNFSTEEIIGILAPIIFVVGYGLILIIFHILAFKRMRDMREPVWKTFLPVYNLYLLFTKPSKR